MNYNCWRWRWVKLHEQMTSQVDKWCHRSPQVEHNKETCLKRLGSAESRCLCCRRHSAERSDPTDVWRRALCSDLWQDPLWAPCRAGECVTCLEDLMSVAERRLEWLTTDVRSSFSIRTLVLGMWLQDAPRPGCTSPPSPLVTWFVTCRRTASWSVWWNQPDGSCLNQAAVTLSIWLQISVTAGGAHYLCCAL